MEIIYDSNPPTFKVTARTEMEEAGDLLKDLSEAHSKGGGVELSLKVFVNGKGKTNINHVFIINYDKKKE